MNVNILIDGVGWAGSVMVVVAYALVSNSRLKATSAPYQVMNLAGSVGLIVNTAFHAAYPSTFVNVVWAAIAAIALVHRVAVKKQW